MWLFPAPSLADGPTNITLPTITGYTTNPEVGQLLTEVNGTWNPAPTSYAYQWERCDSAGANCTDIPYAVGVTYTPTTDDVNSTLRVREIPTFDDGSTATATSDPQTPPVVAAPPPPPPPTVATITHLTISPTNPVTNETVTLIATVTSTDSSVSPSGSVVFQQDGVPIRGCDAVPVSSGDQSATVICPASFGASTMKLTAAFTPGDSSETGSASAPLTLTVDRDTSSTTLDASGTVYIGQSTTYTATVTPPASRAGPIEPTGTVTFFDGATAIAACTNQPLINGGATCKVTYAASGTHSITAQYSGDNNFEPSSSPFKSVTAAPLPHSQNGPISGVITATMQWIFRFTPTYTMVRALVVNGASHARVLVTCRGKGCPYAKRSTVVHATRRCGTGGTRRCSTHGTIDLTRRLRGRRLRVGTRITVMITRPNWIGKYYRFTIRAGRMPKIRIACLAPGSTRPGVGC